MGRKHIDDPKVPGLGNSCTLYSGRKTSGPANNLLLVCSTDGGDANSLGALDATQVSEAASRPLGVLVLRPRSESKERMNVGIGLGTGRDRARACPGLAPHPARRVDGCGASLDRGHGPVWLEPACAFAEEPGAAMGDYSNPSTSFLPEPWVVGGHRRGSLIYRHAGLRRSVPCAPASMLLSENPLGEPRRRRTGSADRTSGAVLAYGPTVLPAGATPFAGRGAPHDLLLGEAVTARYRHPLPDRQSARRLSWTGRAAAGPNNLYWHHVLLCCRRGASRQLGTEAIDVDRASDACGPANSGDSMDLPSCFVRRTSRW